MTNVIGLNGPPTTEPTVIPSCVETLREWLARAEAGECIGVCVIGLHHNGLASYDLAGILGGYSLICAMEAAKIVLMGAAHEQD